MLKTERQRLLSKAKSAKAVDSLYLIEEFNGDTCWLPQDIGIGRQHGYNKMGQRIMEDQVAGRDIIYRVRKFVAAAKKKVKP